MFTYNDETAVSGEFTDGDSLADPVVPRTVLRSIWTNMVQRELINLVEGAGLTLDDLDFAQVLEAVDTISDAKAAAALAAAQATSAAAAPLNYLTGFALANSQVDNLHDISIGAGQAKDQDDAGVIKRTSAIIKQIDAVWAQGNNTGGRASAVSLVADTWYAVFVIGKADGTADAGFDTSPVGANLISDAAANGYVYIRRVGWVLTDASANIEPFIQRGDEFAWYLATNDNAGLTVTDTAGNIRLKNPPENVIVNFNAALSVYTDAVFFYSPDGSDPATISRGGTDPVPSVNGMDNDLGSDVSSNANIKVLTDSSGNIRAKGSDASVPVDITTIGWTDTRGKL